MVKSSELQLDAVFHALSDSTRRSILRDISEGQRTVGDIAKPYAISLAAVSKHLKVLESAELIRREKRGSFQLVHLRADAMLEAERWLRFYERFWNNRLDALQDLLEGDENDR